MHIGNEGLARSAARPSIKWAMPCTFWIHYRDSFEQGYCTCDCSALLKRRKHLAFQCPYCSNEGLPYTQRKLSSNGWLCFVILLLFCFPLFWLPFVIGGFKEEIRKCVSCGMRLG